MRVLLIGHQCAVGTLTDTSASALMVKLAFLWLLFIQKEEERNGGLAEQCLTGGANIWCSL